MAGKTFIIILSCFFTFFSVTNAKNDTAKIGRLIAFAELNRADSQAFSDSIQLAIKVAQQLKTPEYESRARIAYGSFYFVKGYYKLGKDELLMAYRLAEKVKRLDLIGRSARVIGATYERIEHYDSAIYWLNHAVTNYSKLKDNRGLTEAYNSIAITHQNMMNVSMARFYYKKASDFASKSNYYSLQHVINGNLATIYKDEAKYDSAILFYKQTISFQEERKDSFSLYYSYRNLAAVYNDMDSAQVAEYYALKAFNYANSKQEIFKIFDISLALAAIYHKANKLDKEFEMIQLAGSLAPQLKDLSRMLGYYLQLAEYYKSVGEKDKAIDYYRESLVLADSLSGQEALTKLSEIQAKFGLNEKERELAVRALELELEARKTRVSQIVVASLALILMILVIFYLRLKKRKQALHKANQMLESQSEELSAMIIQKQKVIDEKNEIVGVIAHDLRSPVTKIQSLLQMLEMVEKEDEAQIFQLMQVVSNDALSLIQDLIDLSRIDTTEPLELEKKRQLLGVDTLLNKLKASAQPLLEVKKSKLLIQEISEPIALFTNADFIKRALDNLISNAIKFSPAESLITIQVAVKEQFCSIIVTDSGPGFSIEDMQHMFKKFQRLSAQPTGMEQSTGLGLFIAKKLVNAGGGELSLISKPLEPASFELMVPLATHTA